ncbi:hypothetical protein GOODEAATRI_012657 [Goodea atripinnis]|uniref:Uncharacterized protein n=1 Tax=Goodea atripinnis TaxID=208336 RepID=A0ABV0NU16_9TELE
MPYLSRSFSRRCEPTASMENLAAGTLLCYSTIMKQMPHNKNFTGHYSNDCCVKCHFSLEAGLITGDFWQGNHLCSGSRWQLLSAAEGGRATPQRSESEKFCPRARYDLQPVINKHLACRQS